MHPAKKKPAAKPRRPVRPEPGEAGKGDQTRQKILRAARQVFSVHPYNAASIRTIAKVGGFEHPLIHYYFPTKADLFEAVVKEIFEEMSLRNAEWLSDLGAVTPRGGLSTYIDRLLAYDKENPEPYRIIMLNIAGLDRLEEIPGYHYIPEVLLHGRHLFREKIPLQGTDEEIDMFIASFNAMVLFYLGARSCQAQVMKVDPESDAYRAWVKKTLLFLFLPQLKRLILPIPNP